MLKYRIQSLIVLEGHPRKKTENQYTNDVLAFWETHSEITYIYYGQYVYLATEQAETYLKICTLINYLTYICPSLFECAERTLF